MKKLRHQDSLAAHVQTSALPSLLPCPCATRAACHCACCALRLQALNSYGPSRLESAPLNRVWQEASRKTNWLPYHTELADPDPHRQGIAISKFAESVQAVITRMKSDKDGIVPVLRSCVLLHHGTLSSWHSAHTRQCFAASLTMKQHPSASVLTSTLLPLSLSCRRFFSGPRDVGQA